jgi:ABC-type transport system involved in multi-copper enzyme maturation permease subunit
VDQPTDTPPKPKPIPKPAKRPPRAGVVGPLFSWELLRLTRRGQDARARFILATALFLVLTAFSLIWFRNTSAVDLFFGGSQTLTIQESSTFGASFSLTFVYGQLAILCLLTPAYAAGGIAEEKDKKTLVFLLVSDLTDREIVFGKFFGRTAFLLGVLLAGLPILAITQLHGGVSLKFLLLVYLITATTVVLLSAVSAVAAAQAETFRGGLFRAYGLTALIVIAGCGMGPWVSPFAVIYALFESEPNSREFFWFVGLAFPAAELLLAGFAVWLAMRAVRRMRARLTRNTPKPPPWVRERYRDEDREKAWQEKRRKEREEARRALAEAGPPLELTPDEPPPVPVPSTNGDGPPKRLKARRVVVAQPLPQPSATRDREGAGSTNGSEETGKDDRRWDSPRDRKRKAAGYRDPALHAAKNFTPRPKVADADPFYWKEKYTAGAVQTEDDESMRSMMYLIGGVLGLVVLFFFGLAVIGLVNGSEAGRSSARWLLLTAGATGVFGHLLQIGMAACGTVCRERQRLTLESLLTIPEPRRAILWPKWVVSLLRGWWWGGPAAAVLVFAFLTTNVPLTAIPAVVYFAAAVPFATSYGVWLSIRCHTVNRAVMWFLPVAGLVVVFPIAVCAWADAEWWWLWCGLLFTMTCGMIAGAGLFWRAATKAFDVETVLGPGRG